MISICLKERTLDGQTYLSFSIPQLIEEKEFDVYYFSLAIENSQDVLNLNSVLLQLIQFWQRRLTTLVDCETAYLPIDFSDQYIGCLKVTKQHDLFTLNYGYSEKEGWVVNPIYPVDFCLDCPDFNAESTREISVPQSVFFKDLQDIIDKIVLDEAKRVE